jgi:hypothetical protein
MAVSKFTSASGGNDFNINVGSTYSVTNFTQEYAAGSYSFTSAQLDITMDVYAYNAQGTLVGYTNGKGLTTSAGFIKMVIIGGTVGDVLSFTYKTTYYAVAETNEVLAGPVILSTSPTSLPNVNSSTTVTGLNFATDVAVTFTGTDNLVRNAKSVVRGSVTSLVVTRPDNMPVTYNPYTMTATNQSVAYQPTGSAANTLSVTAGVAPIWVTSATQTLTAGIAYSLTLSATDADGGSSITYATVSGSLPPGISFNLGTVTISGTSTDTVNNSVYTYTVRATDSGGNFTDRTFTFTVTVATVTGGTLTSDATYYYRAFTGSGTLTVANGTITADVLVVAGGGGGGSTIGGGGGAGGYKNQSLVIPIAAHSVTVGGGGAGVAGRASQASNGQPSSLGSLLSCIGGGAGASYNTTAGTGGSGGGGSSIAGGSQAKGSGTSGQGFDGGQGVNNVADQSVGAGGGGAGSVGQNGSENRGGSGGGAGQGVTSSISGSSVTYAGGGNGAGHNGAAGPGLGGQGGPTTAGWKNTGVETGSNGVVNTGSGGGGGSYNSGDPRGGDGSSGIVIVRYTRVQVGG